MATIFGKEVAKLRIDQGVKLRELADHFGVSSSYLSAIEAGKKNVPEKSRCWYCRVLRTRLWG